mgnify:CR=1 FL=1
MTDIGDLLEKYAGQPEQGFARYQRAVEVDATYLPALEALERMVEACRLPFFRTYAAYLGAPFATGHADADELTAAAGGAR